MVGAPCGVTCINIELTFPKEEIEELMNVRGIGEASFLKLKALIMATTPTRSASVSVYRQWQRRDVSDVPGRLPRYVPHTCEWVSSF
jgi:hypothetical protein